MPDIGALLGPRSVAVIGASNDISGLRGLIFKVMRSHPYAGPIYPVSRSQPEVQGETAYRSIADVPGPVDLAVLIIPSQYVLDELQRCGEAGVRAVLIITSGFAEQAGDEGRDLQAQVRETAERYDIAVCGPNSEGFANTDNALCPTFSPALNAPDKPLLPPWQAQGKVSVVAQSGAVGFSFYDRGRRKDLPFRHVVTTGNEASLAVFDLVDHMLEEDKTDVFILFLEDIKDAGTFRRVAEKALRAGKPLIATKIGRSEAGRRAAASHTGALAGTYSAYEAMLAHYGVLIGEDNEELVDIAAGFVTNAGRLPQGRRIGICTGSGGAGGWMADACVARGLDVPELDPETRALIDAHLPPYGTSQNPVDGTAQAIRKVGYGELARLTSLSDRVDGVIMVTTARDVGSYAREHDTLFRVARELEKPILCWSYTWPHPDAAALFAEAGFALYTTMRNCARTMALMADYRETRERFLRVPEIKTACEPERDRVAKALEDAEPVLCECDARPLLAAYGLGQDDGALVQSREAARAAAEEIGGPVALKVQSPDILHKTDAGALALDLSTPEAVGDAYDRLMAQATAHAPDAAIKGVLVQPMAPAGVEVILGVNRDAQFGPMLMIGLGGIHVEVLKDVVFAPVPLDPQAARHLIGRLRAAPVLDGVRGAPPADIDALADAAVRLSRFAADHAERIAEIDLNPVLVHPRGRGVSIVDALIVKTEEARD